MWRRPRFIARVRRGWKQRHGFVSCSILLWLLLSSPSSETQRREGKSRLTLPLIICSLSFFFPPLSLSLCPLLYSFSLTLYFSFSDCYATTSNFIHWVIIFCNCFIHTALILHVESHPLQLLLPDYITESAILVGFFFLSPPTRNLSCVFISENSSVAYRMI